MKGLRLLVGFCALSVSLAGFALTEDFTVGKAMAIKLQGDATGKSYVLVHLMRRGNVPDKKAIFLPIKPVDMLNGWGEGHAPQAHIMATDSPFRITSHELVGYIGAFKAEDGSGEAGMKTRADWMEEWGAGPYVMQAWLVPNDKLGDVPSVLDYSDLKRFGAKKAISGVENP